MKHSAFTIPHFAFHLAFLFLALPAFAAAPQPPYQPTAEELRLINAKTNELATALRRLTARKVDDELVADVEVYHKAATYIVRYAGDEFFSNRYVADTVAALERGLARAKELATGRPSWPMAKGQVVRAYRSRVDGSVQPYGLAIPENYDGRTPVRLDVVLHGRGATLNEVSFIAGHDAPLPSAGSSSKSAKPPAAELDGIRLEVFGRGNNAYRWAGETDVFEALDSVSKRYKIDPRRIVLRGFSMGGAGAWHIGLHYPDRWAAVEAGAGFTDTKRYAKLETIPAWQEPTLHIYDAIDYALNAADVPLVGYAGEEDAQLQGSLNIREQLSQAGFRFTADGLNWVTQDIPVVFLVGPKTGHKFHPDSKKRSDEFIAAALGGQSRTPQHIRFVTYTTRYDECFGLKLAALEHHYQPARLDAERSAGGRLQIKTTNVARLTIANSARATEVSIDGTSLRWHAQQGGMSLAKTSEGWSIGEAPAALAKSHGQQGPIDDAFSEAFLCVRGTGTPHSSAAQEYGRVALETFAKEFAKYFRGDIRIKDDTAVTTNDITRHNLILFGDPGSNRVLGRLAPKLPIAWTREAITVGGQAYPAADHTLVLIYPNPLNPRRYVVLNSGHTFRESDLRGTNAMLFPRLGDYAIVEITKKPTPEAFATVGAVTTTKSSGHSKPGDAAEGLSVVTAGFFGEQWELPGSGK